MQPEIPGSQYRVFGLYLDANRLAGILLPRLPLLMRLLMLLWASSCLMVLAGSLLPGFGPPSLFPYFDKAVHFAAWLVLGALTQLLFRHVRWPLATAGVLVSASAAIEVMQLIVPGRSASLGDLAANAGGIAIGTSLGFFVARYLKVLQARQERSRFDQSGTNSGTVASRTI